MKNSESTASARLSCPARSRRGALVGSITLEVPVVLAPAPVTVRQTRIRWHLELAETALSCGQLGARPGECRACTFIRAMPPSGRSC
ncbi:hypothetical protein B0H21DRAFT_885682, partial [Amylocystis lapponica]